MTAWFLGGPLLAYGGLLIHITRTQHRSTTAFGNFNEAYYRYPDVLPGVPIVIMRSLAILAIIMFLRLLIGLSFQFHLEYGLVLLYFLLLVSYSIVIVTAFHRERQFSAIENSIPERTGGDG